MEFVERGRRGAAYEQHRGRLASFRFLQMVYRMFRMESSIQSISI